jgi:hypothetical protein
MKRKMIKWGMCCSMIFGSIFLIQNTTNVQAQTMSCPEYTLHYKQKDLIKWCGSYFQAWSVCEFHAGSMCPCMDETEPKC